MKKKFPYFIIILGILVILYPLASNLYSSFWENRMLQEADQLLTTENSSAGNEDYSEIVSDSFMQMNQAFREENEEESNREKESGTEEGPVLEDTEVNEPVSREEPGSQEEAIVEEETAEDEIISEEENDNEEAAEGNDGSTNNAGVDSTSPGSISNARQGDVIGKIEIPSINVNLPLLLGSDDRTLDRGAGQIIGTAAPGEIGNTGIAAHRANRDGRFFYRLDELGVGDEIVVKTSEGTFIYTVYSTKIVDPTDLSVLNRNQTDQIVTLITCHPRYTADYRLIVHGKLTSKSAL